jgi:hypothetical protein
METNGLSGAAAAGTEAAAPLLVPSTAEAAGSKTGSVPASVVGAGASAVPAPVLRRAVRLLYSSAFGAAVNTQPVHSGRFAVWFALAKAYGLPQWPELTWIAPTRATIEQMVCASVCVSVSVSVCIEPFAVLSDA